MPRTAISLTLVAWLAAGACAQAPTENPRPTPPPKPKVTLSVLEPSGGTCEWRRVEPGRNADVVAKFGGDCVGGRVAWSPNGSQALVWFDPALSSGTILLAGNRPDAAPPTAAAPATILPRLWLIALLSGQQRSLPVPPIGVLKASAFDPQGRPMALTMQTVSVPESQPVHSLKFEGREFSLDPDLDGIPVLVHAYRLTADDRWQRVETKASTTGSDMAPEVHVLKAARGLSVRSTELLSPHLEAPAVEAAPLLAQLREAAPELIPGDEGGWVQVASRPARVLVWRADVEFTFATGRLFFLSGDRLVAPPQLDRSAKDIVAVMVRDPYVLVATDTVGTHPRLYDLNSLQLLFKSDTAWATTYWPVSQEGR